MTALIPSWFKNSYKKYRKARRTRKQIRLFKGDVVFCPFCKSTFREFGVFGISKRPNARCHKCGSLERHRLQWKYLTEKLKFFDSHEPVKLLHFAPEKMFYDIFSEMPNLEYVPCDLFPSKYSYKGKAEILKVDITNIPFPDNTFDFILCSHVLEHIPDDRLAMQELYRVMKPHGSGIFQVPIPGRPDTYEDFSIQRPEDREKAFGQHDHVRVYGFDYPDRLRSAGFKVTEDDFARSFSPEECFRLGINASEVLYFCQKL